MEYKIEGELEYKREKRERDMEYKTEGELEYYRERDVEKKNMRKKTWMIRGYKYVRNRKCW